MQNTVQIIRFHRYNVFHVHYPTAEYLRPGFFICAHVYPSIVRSSYCTLYHRVPADAIDSLQPGPLPFPRTSYWHTKASGFAPMIHRCQRLLVLPSVTPCKTQAKSSGFTGTIYSMYITQRLNIRGLVVPLPSCLPQHGTKFISHIVPSRPCRCYILISRAPGPPTGVPGKGILIRPMIHRCHLLLVVRPSIGVQTHLDSPRDSPLYAFWFAVLCFVRQQNCSACASARGPPEPNKVLVSWNPWFSPLWFLLPLCVLMFW